jgi:hypothetical protein
MISDLEGRPSRLTRFFHWYLPAGRLGRFALGLLGLDWAIAILVFSVVGFAALDRPFAPVILLLLAGVAVAGQGLAGSFLTGRIPSGPWMLTRVLVGSLISALVYSILRPHLSGVVGIETFIEVLLILTPLQLATRRLHEPAAPALAAGGRSSDRLQERQGDQPVDRKLFAAAWRHASRAFALFAVDGLIVAAVVAVGAGFWFETNPKPAQLVFGALVLANTTLALRSLRGRGPATRADHLLRLAAGNLLGFVVVAYFPDARTGLPAGEFALLLPWITLLQAGPRMALTSRGQEQQDEIFAALRWALLGAGALWINQPLITAGTFGAGDADWYRTMVADFIQQWRSGTFAVFVGQSEYAFNGGISPLRFAPALQHFCGMVDVLTGRTLEVQVVLNLTLLACLVGGAATAYACLRAMAPQSSWLALALALAYSTCPGILGLAFVGDLFMSVTTIPFVPILLHGCWRTLKEGGLRTVLIMVAPAAALWYCHPPIALWGTLAAALTQIVRLARDGLTLATWRDWLAGAGAFTALSLYAFVSVGTLQFASHPLPRAVMIQNLQEAFATSIQPLSDTLVSLGDYQLGWLLWCVLLGTVALAPFVRRRMPAFGLLAAGGLVVAFLLPIPWLLTQAWSLMPQIFCNITHQWPMQRLYVILAGITATAGMAVWGQMGERHRAFSWFATIFVAFGLIWSALETKKYHTRAESLTVAPALAGKSLMPQNIALTRFSYNSFPITPSYFSHGFVDPYAPNRILAAADLRELSANDTRLGDASFGTLVASGDLTTPPTTKLEVILPLDPVLRLEPGKRYVFTIEFFYPELAGALTLNGSRMKRLYWLPDSGYGTNRAEKNRTFGSAPEQFHSLTLWTNGTEPEDIRIVFIYSTAPLSPAIERFGRFTLREIDPAGLPVTVTDWVPYRANVQVAEAAYVETPRIHIAGYEARVNSRSVPVERSPEGLVMIPVPPGSNAIELTYPGPLSLRVAYFTSLIGWALLSFWLMRGWQRAQATRPSQAGG